MTKHPWNSKNINVENLPDELKDPELAGKSMRNIIEAVFNFDSSDHKNDSENNGQSSNQSKKKLDESSDDFTDEELSNSPPKKLPTISDLSAHMRKIDLDDYAVSRRDFNPSRNEIISLRTHQDYDIDLSRNYYDDKRAPEDNHIAEKKKKGRHESSGGLSSSNPSSNKQSSSQQSFKYSTSSALIFIKPDD